MRRVNAMLYGCVLCALTAAQAQAQEFFPPTPLDEEARPALIYAEQTTGQAQRLFLAYKKGEAWNRFLLASGNYVAVQHLAEAKILVSVGNTPDDSQLHLADLTGGTSKTVSGRKGFDPINFPGPQPRFMNWPESNKAFLIQDSAVEESLEFITIDTAAMTLEAYMIPKSKLMDPWRHDLPIAIAANGTHFAYAEPIGAVEGKPRAQKFRIECYHFSNHSVTPEDENVTVQTSSKAPADTQAWPPLGWPDFTVVGYATVEPVDEGQPDQAQFIFKKVDVHAHKPEEIFSQTLPLTFDGGTMYIDKKLNASVFVHRDSDEERFGIDPKAMTLLPLPAADEIVLTHEAGGTQVGDKQRLLYNSPTPLFDLHALRGKGRVWAYSVRPESETAKATLMVNLEEGNMEAVGDPSDVLRPLVWIE